MWREFTTSTLPIEKHVLDKNKELHLMVESKSLDLN